jgi:hypothetical protein
MTMLLEARGWVNAEYKCNMRVAARYILFAKFVIQRGVG